MPHIFRSEASLNVRCDDKVLVYKRPGKGNKQPVVQLCVSADAEPALLANGFSLGKCAEGTSVQEVLGDYVADNNEVSVIKGYPNPFTSQFTLTFKLEKKLNNVILDIYDLAGNRLKRVYTGNTNEGQEYTFSIDATSFHGKFLNARLSTPGKVYNFRLVKD